MEVVLALQDKPKEVVENLKRLEKYGMYNKYGFYDEFGLFTTKA